MNQIEEYLRENNCLDCLVESDTQDVKLEQFYNLFVLLKEQYEIQLENAKRMEETHKAELTNLENHIFQVKKLTEEREKLTNDFKIENNELRSKLQSQETKRKTKKKQRKDEGEADSDDDESNLGDYDDLSEATIEMLVLEGFGNIVAVPNHEKIAALLADRLKLNEQIKNLKVELSNQSQLYDENRIVEMENEIEMLKSANQKLSCEIASYKRGAEINSSNEIVMKEEIAELKKLQRKYLDDENYEVYLAMIEAGKMEITKLKEDNLSLKLEVDKLYDEISSFEIENKQLKDEKKKLKAAESTKDELDSLKKTINELKKQNSELLNNQVNYEKLKVEYDNLREHHDELTSPRRYPASSLQIQADTLFASKSSSDFHSSSLSPNSKGKTANAQLELKWIKGENEKLLLELEKLQTKLNDKLDELNLLKERLYEKDEQIKNLIDDKDSLIGKNANLDEELRLQRKILDLEHQIDELKETRRFEMEQFEEKSRDLSVRNDKLWSKLAQMEAKYKETLEIVKFQNEQIENYESLLNKKQKEVTDLEKELDAKKESLIEVKKNIADLELQLEEAKSNVLLMNKSSEQVSTKMKVEREKRLAELKANEREIGDLKEKNKSLEKKLSNKQTEIESLNREKLFMMNQSENTNQKLIQDYLSLQEKYAQVNFHLEKSGADQAALNKMLKEKDKQIDDLDHELSKLKNRLIKEEEIVKNLTCDLRSSEASNIKNQDKINDLLIKLDEAKIYKTKFELKIKELDEMRMKNNELIREIDEKQELVSKILEKNGRLDTRINELEKHLYETKNVSAELNRLKDDIMKKSEETLKSKQKYENERFLREENEKKTDELESKLATYKMRISKMSTELTSSKAKTIELENSVQSMKGKLDYISDKTHTEYEKNSALQDQLNEAQIKMVNSESELKKLNLKCGLIRKKYAALKEKCMKSMLELREQTKKEREKFKELLFTEGNNQKNYSARDISKNLEPSRKVIDLEEEKFKLGMIITMKETKLRELKRLNLMHESRISIQEEEINSLNGKIGDILKQRNSLRRQLHLDLFKSTTNIIIDETINNKQKQQPYQQYTTVDNINQEVDYRTNSSIWDVNYNVGYFN